MKWLRYWMVLLLVLCVSPLAVAGLDPISWSLNTVLPGTTVKNLLYPKPADDYFIYTFTNNLPYKLNCPLTVEVLPSTSEFIDLDNQCVNKALNPGEQCIVKFRFRATTTGKKSISLIMHYGKDIVPLPAMTTEVVDGPNPLVKGELTPGFRQPEVGAGEQGGFGFTYTNTNNGTVTGITCPDLPTEVVTQTGGSIFQDTTCTCGPTLPPGDSCKVSFGASPGIYQFGVAGPYELQHTLTYFGGPTTLSNSTTAVMKIESVNPPQFPLDNNGYTSAGSINTLTFQFTNNGYGPVYGVTPATLEAVETNVGATSFLTNCLAGSLALHASCFVNLEFKSGLASPLSYFATVAFNYLGGSAQAPQTAGPTPGKIMVTNTIANSADDLPANIGTGENHNVIFTFTNPAGFGDAWGLTNLTTFLPSGGSCVSTTSSCGPTLAAGDSCTSTCTFRAIVPGNASVTKNFEYAGGVVSKTSATATVTNNVTGIVFSPSPFPTKIGVNVGQPVTFRFTNNGTTAVQGTPNITITLPGNPNSWTPSSDGCTGTSLAAGASCDVVGTFTGRVTGDTAVSATFNYAGPAVTASAPTNVGRVVTLLNRCNQNVWYSFNGALTQYVCTTSADCPSGSVCNPSANAGTGACYWQNPEPLTGTLVLPPMIGTTPSSSTVIVPDKGATLGGIWQGQIAGRTSCTGSPLTCSTGTCGGNTTLYPKGSCAAGAVFGGPTIAPNLPTTPVTKAEFKLIKNAADQYGIQASNGINLSMSMGPGALSTQYDTTDATPYSCARAGYAGIDNPTDAPSTPTANKRSYSACSWTPVLPATPASATSVNARNYVWVKNTADVACTNNLGCPAPGEVCGLSFDTSASPKFKRVCGIPLGYWTANQACIADHTDAQAFFNCDNPSSPNTPVGSFVKNLYSCSPVVGTDLASCYIAGATTNCCGCVDWRETALILGVPLTTEGTQACVAVNAAWTPGTGVQLTIDWIKKMCPQLITYPDDTGSTRFTCNTLDTASPATTNTNTSDYVVTFCPEVVSAPFAKKKASG